jgi:antitoxin ParD1/3/4
VYHGARWPHAALIHLGFVPGDRCSVAESINTKGQVVGASGMCHGSRNAESGGLLIVRQPFGRIHMNVSLTPELERLVNEKVESGLYQTASEVVREALRLLKERDQAREQLRGDVQAGFDQFSRGERRAHDRTSGRQLAERIKSRGRAGRAKKP